jgi:serine/threonine-protein kinase
VTDSRLLFEGKYEVLAKIREGGMGAVYEARHRLLDEIRVIKVMRPGARAEPDLERRFLEEARIATRLRHPNLCAIHDFAIDERGTAYLVMEHVDGLDLAEFLRSQGVPALGLTLEIAHQALLALGYLHRKGIVHRDVAPDNLMLTYDEDRRPLVKLIDLGIARVIEGDADLTASGVFLGKPSYASPEQLGVLPPGERIDSRSDLYGLGVVLYELLTGRLPFRGASPAELLAAQRHIVPFEESDPSGRVPADVRAVVLEALEPDREDRFDSADEFDRAVSALQRRYGPRKPLEVTPEMLADARRRDAVPDASPDWTRLDPTFEARRNAPGARGVPLVDPDPLHTVRLATDRPEPPRPEPPSLESVPLIGSAASGAAERRLAVEPARPRPREARTPNRGDPARPDMGVPLRRTRSRKGIHLLELAAFAVAAVAVVAVWWTWPSRERRAAATAPRPAAPAAAPATPAPLVAVAVTPPPGDAAPPSPVASTEPAPTAQAGTLAQPVPPPPASSLPTPAALAAEPAPTAQPGPPAQAQLAPTPAPEPKAQPPASPRDELSRLARETAAARASADEARGRDFAPTTYGRAAAKQASAEKLAARGSTATAASLYRDAAGLFARAAAVARETHSSPARAARSRATVPPAARAEPPAVVPPEPSPVAPPDRGGRAAASPDASSEAVAEPPQTPVPEGMSAETRAEAHREIVRAIGDYAFARRHRDSGALARVFPSDSGRFAQDSTAVTPPVVTVEVQAIDFQSATHATAAVQERLTPAQPAEGGPSEWATVVLELEKGGDRWIIVSRRRL